MSRNLDMTLLRSFVAVMDTAGMTAAAKALNLTQGAVSQQIRRLEDQFGFPLFRRAQGRLKPTADAERLLPMVRRLLGQNDEIWAEVTGGAVSGRVRFGVPYDLVGTILAPVIKGFAEARPQVEIALTCAASPELAERLAAGEIDLAVIEAPEGAGEGEILSVERLVWAGARGGTAHLKRPLPVSMVADSCAFRPAVLAALAAAGLSWRTVFENGNIEATTATVRTDLAVTAWLASTVPADLAILGAEAGLPALPNFAVNLHLPARDVGPAVREFARLVRDGLMRRH
ncbi:MAG: LysR family transcriptional regulator [Alphaproteobacteria bacterium]|jgi:DNA-binding transcriptional LysR family regulator|nr:LysR family transcriptional regulator [Alphaproteobacteria bacterium]